MDKNTKTKAEGMAEKLALMATMKAGGAHPGSQAMKSNSPAPQFSGPRTMPGMVFGAQDLLRETNEQVQVLQGRLSEFEGALPVRLIDAQNINPSKWANRDESSFNDIEFQSLKAEIQAAGGNVQPIKVRRNLLASSKEWKGVGPSYPPQDSGYDGTDHAAEYELVFGHRRHRACLELGLPVLSMIDEVLTDRDLFEQMERENRERKNLSPWEQGRMYARALDESLFPSASKLSEAINRDLSDVGKALALVRLPKDVIDAIGNRQALQFRWSKPLKDAIQADPDGVLRKAKAIVERGGERDPRAVFEALTAQEVRGVGPSHPPKKTASKTIDLGLGVKLKHADFRTFELSFGKRKLTEDQATSLMSGLKELIARI
jgi:ParB family transcriptional regulator, chromosome partitioning protein